MILYTVLALKRVMDNEGMDLDIIINPKTTDDGQAVIQVCLLFCDHVLWQNSFFF